MICSNKYVSRFLKNIWIIFLTARCFLSGCLIPVTYVHSQQCVLISYLTKNNLLKLTNCKEVGWKKEKCSHGSAIFAVAHDLRRRKLRQVNLNKDLGVWSVTKNNCSVWETLPCDWEVRGHCICKLMRVILINTVVDPKRIIRKNGGPRRKEGTKGRWPPQKDHDALTVSEPR
jgi:hypothetical protein